MLTREQILAAKGPDTETVHVPEWGGDVLVRGFTGTERDRFELGSLAHKDNLEQLAGLRAKVVSWTTLGEDGRQLFTPKDLPWLGDQPAQALDRIYTVALRLSGVNAKAVEAAEEVFTDGRSGGSTSASPATSASPSASSSSGPPPPSSPNGSPTNGSPDASVLNAPTF